MHGYSPFNKITLFRNLHCSACPALLNELLSQKELELLSPWLLVLWASHPVMANPVNLIGVRKTWDNSKAHSWVPLWGHSKRIVWVTLRKAVNAIPHLGPRQNTRRKRRKPTSWDILSHSASWPLWCEPLYPWLPHHEGLKPLKLGTQINISFLKLFLPGILSQLRKSD